MGHAAEVRFVCVFVGHRRPKLQMAKGALTQPSHFIRSHLLHTVNLQ